MVRKFLLSLLCMALCVEVNAQQVNVNQFTGTGIIAIPLFNIRSGECAMPVSLIYATNGALPTDKGMRADWDWQVNIGGEITRNLRGLPDDIKKDLSNNFNAPVNLSLFIVLKKQHENPNS